MAAPAGATTTAAAGRVGLPTLLAYVLPAFVVALPTIPVFLHVPHLYGVELGLGLAATGFLLLAARVIDTLADPLVDLDVDVQFRALVEACHALGMRVICEFVFRTASRDADFIAEHPDWFYWIKREIAPGPAITSRQDLSTYGRAVHHTVYHPLGGCKIGAVDDPTTVVGPDLRVKGVEGLRVADGAIFPALKIGRAHV